jgi:predicted DNA-binding mobile mystery protein A
MAAPGKLRNPQANQLRIRQLDETLRGFQNLQWKRAPRSGWIKEIRKALGMRNSQLAKRIGQSITTTVAFQRNEERGAITLNSLRKAAEALNCDVVYALVPRESLGKTVNDRLQQKAAEKVGRVGRTMELEAQTVNRADTEQQVEDLVQKWKLQTPPDLWD